MNMERKITPMGKEPMIDALVGAERTAKFRHDKAQPHEKRDFSIIIETIREIRTMIESGKFDIRG